MQSSLSGFIIFFFSFYVNLDKQCFTHWYSSEDIIQTIKIGDNVCNCFKIHKHNKSLFAKRYIENIPPVVQYTSD